VSLDRLHITARRYNFVSVTRRSIRVESRYPASAGPESCHGARRVRRGFCHPGTSFVSYTSVAVQSLLGTEKFIIKVHFVKLRCGRGILSRCSF